MRFVSIGAADFPRHHLDPASRRKSGSSLHARTRGAPVVTTSRLGCPIFGSPYVAPIGREPVQAGAPMLLSHMPRRPSSRTATACVPSVVSFTLPDARDLASSGSLVVCHFVAHSLICTRSADRTRELNRANAITSQKTLAQSRLRAARLGAREMTPILEYSLIGRPIEHPGNKNSEAACIRSALHSSALHDNTSTA